ncbi:MAG TPA: DoxX family protein, partial [Lacipirellulaceae bacterium]|nr:DoxX family protein [Lacipirellulaceae bacterium]
QKAEKALETRLEELADFFAESEQDIVDYRHELWRLNEWRQSPEAGGLPFLSQRIAAKNSETAAKAAGWKEEVHALEDGLHHDLDSLLTPEQRAQPATASAFDAAIADENQHKLDFINIVATAVTIGVGACLILGFFTRLASLAGALFLFGVIASQPFWIAGTAPTINQCVELAALLVLAGTGAGRWAGMDGCLRALFGRRRTLTVVEN